MRILDLTAGNRAIWFNKNHPDAVYLDKRREVKPDVVHDVRHAVPLDPGFDLIVFDPPHMNCGKNSNMSRVYGYHTTKEILITVGAAGREAARLAKVDGLMALKWNDHDIKLTRVLELMPDWEPLFGHLTKDGPGSKTYWVMLKKRTVLSGVSQSEVR